MACADPSETAALLERAHATAKDAIVELRDLARGIHPPVLDAGLHTALATLVAHSAIPVEWRTAVDRRPAPAIETIAYFCAAELLTNAAKPSPAPRAPGSPSAARTGLSCCGCPTSVAAGLRSGQAPG